MSFLIVRLADGCAMNCWGAYLTPTYGPNASEGTTAWMQSNAGVNTEEPRAVIAPPGEKWGHVCSPARLNGVSL